MVNRGSFWGEAPFHLLQPVLLGVLTGLVWMVLDVFLGRADVCYFTGMAFTDAIGMLVITFVIGVVLSGVRYLLNPQMPRVKGGPKGSKWRRRCRLQPAKTHRLWIYIGVSVFSAFAWVVYRECEHSRQMSWIGTNGVITEVERRFMRGLGGRGRMVHHWIVSRYKYSYQIVGVEYSGTFYGRVPRGSRNNRKSERQTWNVKDKITVYYDPHDPSDSVKIRAEGAGLNFAWACFLAVMGVGVWWRSRSAFAACKVGQQGEKSCANEMRKS